MIIIGFGSIVEVLWQKMATKIGTSFLFHFLSVIMCFQIVGMVTIATTELRPDKF